MPIPGQRISKAEKVEYVKRQGQTREHTCHWPGCGRQVPPAMWGCKKHWFRLPKNLREMIWKTYIPGQEISLTPSAEYLDAATKVQEWIQSQKVYIDDADPYSALAEVMHGTPVVAQGRRERLAINLCDLDRIEPLIRQMLLKNGDEDRVDRTKVVRCDPSRMDESAVVFTCDLVTAACICDTIREHDRQAGQYPTRVYLQKAVAWDRLPADAILSIVGKDGSIGLSQKIFGTEKIMVTISEDDFRTKIFE